MKTKNNISFVLMLLISTFLLFSGCRSNKALVKSGGAIAQKDQDQLIKDLVKKELSYKTISGKVSLKLGGGDRHAGMKVNSYLKIVRDDIVQLSIRAPFINTELFRINISPDSICFIDRIAKKYAVGNIAELRKKKELPFNYNNLEALFTNRFFVPGKATLNKSDYKLFNRILLDQFYQLTHKDRFGIRYDFKINSNDRIVETKASKIDADEYAIRWTYDTFIEEKGYIYPSNMTSFLTIQKKRVQLEMNYSGLEFDKDLHVDRSLPAKYQQVSFFEILQNYIK